MTRQFKKRLAIVCAKAAFSAALLGMIVHRLDVAEIYRHVKHANFGFVLLGVLAVSGTVAVSARRWQVLAQGLFDFSHALQYTLIGMFYGAILPGAISGDVAKGAAMAVKRKDARVLALPVSILLDRLVGMVALFLFFNVSCGFLAFARVGDEGALRQFGFYGFLGSGVFLAGAILALTKGVQKLLSAIIAAIPVVRVRELGGRLLEALYRSSQQPGLVARAFLLSLGVHFLNVLLYCLLIRALGITLGIAMTAVFYSLLSVVVMLPISISGLGVRDLVSLLFFQNIDQDGEAGVAFSWLLLLVMLALSSLGGVLQLCDVLWPTRRNGGVLPIASEGKDGMSGETEES